jgi:glucan phosphoethanolaminetransferase (alkaline phosphatase superfamily)
MESQNNNNDKDFTKRISYVYLIGIVLWILFFYYMNGFTIMKNDKTYIISIIFILGILFLLLNYWFTRREILQDYATEVGIYSYVEKNAAIALGVPLGIAILISFVAKDEKVQKQSIAFALVGFLILLLGVLTIIWMPTQDTKYINGLKHIKTVPLMIGTLSIAIAMAIIASYHILHSNGKSFVSRINIPGMNTK